MIKLLKRICASLLILCALATATPIKTVSAATNDVLKTVTVERIGEMLAYLEKGPASTISFTELNGIVEFTILTNGFIYTGSFEADSKNSTNEIRRKVLAAKSDSKKQKIDDVIVKSVEDGSSNYGSDIAIIRGELDEDGNKEQTMRQIKTKTTKVTAYLYGESTYSINKKTHYHIVAGATISMVMAIVGLSPVTILALVSFALAADGLYHAVADSKLTEYTAVVNNMKYVMVRNQMVYNAYHNKVYTGYVGNRGGTVYYDYSNSSSDYNDDDGLLLTGLKNAGF